MHQKKEDMNLQLIIIIGSLLLTTTVCISACQSNAEEKPPQPLL